jgi:hypothetical protein
VTDKLATVLRLVAEGHLSPEEAAPIIDALGGGGRVRQAASPDAAASHAGEHGGVHVHAPDQARHVRVRVTERGRTVVNLRVPLAFAEMALKAVPGLGAGQSDRIRAAIESGSLGPILDVEDPVGDGVLITLE